MHILAIFEKRQIGPPADNERDSNAPSFMFFVRGTGSLYDHTVILESGGGGKILSDGRKHCSKELAEAARSQIAFACLKICLQSFQL